MGEHDEHKGDGPKKDFIPAKGFTTAGKHM